MVANETVYEERCSEDEGIVFKINFEKVYNHVKCEKKILDHALAEGITVEVEPLGSLPVYFLEPLGSFVLYIVFYRLKKKIGWRWRSWICGCISSINFVVLIIRMG